MKAFEAKNENSNFEFFLLLFIVYRFSFKSKLLYCSIQFFFESIKIRIFLSLLLADWKIPSTFHHRNSTDKNIYRLYAIIQKKKLSLLFVVIVVVVT